MKDEISYDHLLLGRGDIGNDDLIAPPHFDYRYGLEIAI